MEEATPIYEADLSEAEPKQMAPWLIVLLIVLGVCVVCVLVPVCVITILTLLGPAVGDIFNDIVMGL